MKEKALKIAGIFFLLISILHLIRWVLKIEVTINNWTVPQWVSVAGFIFLSLLSWWMFKTANRK